MKEIQLTNWGKAFVDDADFSAVKAFRWFAVQDRRRVYAARAWRKPDGTNTVQRLHTFLLPDAKQVDHKDGNGLNNCRDNLRPATQQQNQQGYQSKRKGTTSQYRGVSWHTIGKKWKASITVDGRTHHLGLFKDEADAALAFDEASERFCGAWGFKNFPTK